jgi:hypothetical protein
MIDRNLGRFYARRMATEKSSTMGISDAIRMAAEQQRTGRSDVAANIYRQILQADPNNGDALHLLGLIEIDQARYTEAEELFRKAVERHPSTTGFQISHGLSLALIGRVDEALAKVAALLARTPGDERARQVLARILRCGPEMTAMVRQTQPREAITAQAGSAPSQTLVVGMAGGYSADALMPFALSLRRHYDGPVHIFTDGGPEVTNLFDSHDIGWSHVSEQAVDFATLRWKLTADYLEGIADDVWVYLVDVGDVVFQGNPFAFSAPGGLIAFLEDGAMTIGECPWNRDWVRINFGHAMLDSLATRTISCCGTILGSCSKLREYLAQFCVLAGTLSVPPKIGVDQAIHNIILHHAMISGATLVSNGWPVSTVQHMAKDAIGVAADGAIVLADGRVPAVVHQYNRRADMISAVRNQYSPANNPN